MPTTIKKPSDHFNPVLYTGVNPSAATVTTGFEPGFVWIKSRTQTYSHYLYNSVLGGGRWLYSNATSVEDTSGDAITFSSTGFTTTGSAGATNEAGQGANNLISWVWKTASSNTTNTNGTITSIVRANQTAGFSVVTYTSSSGTNTVGHGLGVAPKMVIWKSRSSITDWVSYHASLGASQYINLNSTSAAATNNLVWNNTAPSSTVVTIGSDLSTYGNIVMYCWAEVEGFSRFGSYTGNGSADGPFVYCGFKPAFVLIKNTTGNNWTIVDNKRDASNVAKRRLFPSANATEDSGANNVDMLSNGFKLRISGASDAGANQNATTFIYAAFAENPFKYANAR